MSPRITDNPKEWRLIDAGTWQNILVAEAFSNDAGRHYYLTSEGAHNWHRHPLHESLHKD